MFNVLYNFVLQDPIVNLITMQCFQEVGSYSDMGTCANKIKEMYNTVKLKKNQSSLKEFLQMFILLKQITVLFCNVRGWSV